MHTHTTGHTTAHTNTNTHSHRPRRVAGVWLGGGLEFWRCHCAYLGRDRQLDHRVLALRICRCIFAGVHALARRCAGHSAELSQHGSAGPGRGAVLCAPHRPLLAVALAYTTVANVLLMQAGVPLLAALMTYLLFSVSALRVPPGQPLRR